MLESKQYNANNLVVLVVPCFNEEARWAPEYWESVSKIPDLKLYFVNEGSLDQTSSRITPLLGNSQNSLLELPKNLGKAEAIRFGFQQASLHNPLGIGFLDADGAFPIEEVRIQIDVFRKLNLGGQDPISVWSSRVQLAGRDIERKLQRHYVARVLVTFLAIILKFKIYDTQSGMKIFPVTPTLLACLEKKFKTRWFIDLELFIRWRFEAKEEMAIWEEPLLAWRDIAGSKVSGKQYLTILNDLRKLVSYKIKN
jgi:glycosyltransferase involved in cell wall biosynthesis